MNSTRLRGYTSETWAHLLRTLGFIYLFISSLYYEFLKDLYFYVSKIWQAFSCLSGKQLSDLFLIPCFKPYISYTFLPKLCVFSKPCKESSSFRGLKMLLRPSSLPSQFASERGLAFLLSKGGNWFSPSLTWAGLTNLLLINRRQRKGCCLTSEAGLEKAILLLRG